MSALREAGEELDLDYAREFMLRDNVLDTTPEGQALQRAKHILLITMRRLNALGRRPEFSDDESEPSVSSAENSDSESEPSSNGDYEGTSPSDRRRRTAAGGRQKWCENGRVYGVLHSALRHAPEPLQAAAPATAKATAS